MCFWSMQPELVAPFSTGCFRAPAARDRIGLTLSALRHVAYGCTTNSECRTAAKTGNPLALCEPNTGFNNAGACYVPSRNCEGRHTSSKSDDERFFSDGRVPACRPWTIRGKPVR